MKSIPDYCWHKRLNDNAASWGGGIKTRFTSTNECDFILYDCSTCTLSAMELKSTKSTLTLWREDFEKECKEKGKKPSYNIKKNQILGLKKWKDNYTINCGFLFNFRNENNDTFYVDIDDFLYYTNNINKKSIGLKDVLNMNHIKVENHIIKTNYKYNVDKLLKEIKLS